MWEADLIAGESLKSLKSEGRGRGAKGRWVHWRNNSQIRGALWRCLRYKCHLCWAASGLAARSRHDHTCPHCGKPAHTYASPALDCNRLDAGAWLRCFACGWNGARDYAAAINIALLGVASLVQDMAHTEQQTSQTSDHDHKISQLGVLYGFRAGATVAANTLAGVPRERKDVRQWLDKSVTLHSAFSQETMLRLCG